MVRPVQAEGESAKSAQCVNNMTVKLPADINDPAAGYKDYDDTRFGQAQKIVSWPTGTPGVPRPFIVFDKTEYIIEEGNVLYNIGTADALNSANVIFTIKVTADERSTGRVEGVLDIIDILPNELEFINNVSIEKEDKFGSLTPYSAYTEDVPVNKGDKLIYTFGTTTAPDAVLLDCGESFIIKFRATVREDVDGVALSEDVRNKGWAASSKPFYFSLGDTPANWEHSTHESSNTEYTTADLRGMFILYQPMPAVNYITMEMGITARKI